MTRRTSVPPSPQPRRGHRARKKWYAVMTLLAALYIAMVARVAGLW